MEPRKTREEDIKHGKHRKTRKRDFDFSFREFTCIPWTKKDFLNEE
jgi:hypothetical protein